MLGPFKHTATPQLDSFLSELIPMPPFPLVLPESMPRPEPLPSTRQTPKVLLAFGPCTT
jgi:hypothetical protein